LTTLFSLYLTVVDLPCKPTPNSLVQMPAPGFDDVCMLYDHEMQVKTYPVSQCRMALTTAHYEQEYERAVGRTTLLLEIERAREIRMQQLLLQFENDSLRLQLGETSGELVRARGSESCLRVQFNKTLNEANRLKNVLAVSSHEIENLRVRCPLYFDLLENHSDFYTIGRTCFFGQDCR
jgi:hypothetical protein